MERQSSALLFGLFLQGLSTQASGAARANSVGELCRRPLRHLLLERDPALPVLFIANALAPRTDRQKPLERAGVRECNLKLVDHGM